MIDVIADAYALPWRGCDIELQQQSVNVGARVKHRRDLKRLGIDAQNARRLARRVGGNYPPAPRQRGLTSVISRADGDNGWCLALVEPDGERTFMSFSGVENQWCDAWLERLHAPPAAGLSFRLSVGICQRRTAGLRLERQAQVSAFIDFGPRIADIPETLMARLMALKPLVSVNRRGSRHRG